VSDIGTEKWLAAHQRQHPAAVIVEPINGTLGHVLGHAFDFVVEGPAIPAIEIALVVEEKVGGDGMKFAGHHARSNVGQEPTARLAPYLLHGPVAF
jgi:hypothetical protein